ncbi:MAG: helix-turn-helix domain-containing protein [Actinomycetota bacterium]|nr:helix-turn-helix domain-containing protein [Actinomycetota bacterium]
MTDRLMRPREVAIQYALPRDLVYEGLKSGRLKAIHRGNRHLVPEWAVAAFIRELTKED